MTMEKVYEGGVKATLAIAKWQTRRLQNGSLFQYLVVIIGATVIGVGGALLRAGAMRVDWSGPSLPIWLGLLLVCMLIAIGIVVRTRSRLLAICGLGVIGTGMAVIFLAYGAPDVGLTQLLVETLTLIIAAIVLLRLPSIEERHRPGFSRMALSLVVAVASGALVTGLMLAVQHTEVDRAITAFYEQASYVKAHGRNIVNVILVDFRSLDTLGEIIVVAASALSALALIRGKTSAS
jgi:multicomponent Na+:H+ antiporter subunit A